MLKIQRFVLPFSILLVFVFGTSVYAQEDGATEHNKAAFASKRAKLLQKIKQNWSDQIERAEEDVDTTELDLTGSNGEIVVHGGYAVTSTRNPMVNEKCRTESLAEAVLHWQHTENLSNDQAFEASGEHLRSQQEEFRKGITFTDWIKHIADCKVFCNVAVLKLLQCHIESVSRHPHEIVLFDFDSYSIISKSANDKLSRFASEIFKDPSKNILLLGRASLAGTAGIEYNRELSLRRVVAVRKALLGENVPQKRIRMLHLGNEEPQLNGWIAEMYGMKDIYLRVGKIGINQSVVMVLY